MKKKKINMRTVYFAIIYIKYILKREKIEAICALIYVCVCSSNYLRCCHYNSFFFSYFLLYQSYSGLLQMKIA